MFSRFFGKRDKSKDSLTKEVQDKRGLEVVEDDPDTAWSARDRAKKAQEARTPSPVIAAMPAPQEMQLDFVLPTANMELEQSTAADSKSAALETVERHHKRIANTIRTLWGYKECSVYINKLIMAGGDGMGHARVGFNQEAVEAMLLLSDLHDAEFGPPDSVTGGLGLSI
jgi:hypothetical protein